MVHLYRSFQLIAGPVSAVCAQGVHERSEPLWVISSKTGIGKIIHQRARVAANAAKVRRRASRCIAPAVWCCRCHSNPRQYWR